jgi:hypothetical protein
MIAALLPMVLILAGSSRRREIARMVDECAQLG